MKSIAILAGAILVIALIAIFNEAQKFDGLKEKTISTDNVVLEEWKEFKATHNKQYKSLDEEKNRFKIYLNNRIQLAKHNLQFAQGLQTYTKSINHLSDMTHEEVVKARTGLKINKEQLIQLKKHSLQTLEINDVTIELPKSVDWREKGLVTPVKNQGHCGSCWAFSATGALEGAHAKATGKLVSLSEQNLVDCDIVKDDGCQGGLPINAFQYVIDNNGIDTEQSYPYISCTGQYGFECKFNNKTIGMSAKSLVILPEGNEKKLQEAVANIGPVSVGIDASDAFRSYSHGVFVDDTCSPEVDNLDHGVLIVGYGTDDKFGDYWLVKNSWSTIWGDSGYIKMARNRKNMCGIATLAAYPIV